MNENGIMNAEAGYVDFIPIRNEPSVDFEI